MRGQYAAMDMQYSTLQLHHNMLYDSDSTASDDSSDSAHIHTFMRHMHAAQAPAPAHVNDKYSLSSQLNTSNLSEDEAESDRGMLRNVDTRRSAEKETCCDSGKQRA